MNRTSGIIAPSTVWFGECLDVMRRWDARQVDLIYLEPSSSRCEVLPGTTRRRFSRRERLVEGRHLWQWDGKAAERLDGLKAGTGEDGGVDRGRLARAFSGVERLLGPSGTLSYLSWMGERLIECRRLLKENGRIFLHCDHRTTHHLRVLMDAIFTPEWFQSEIRWTEGWAGRANRCMFGSDGHRILFYGQPCQVKDEIGAPFDDDCVRAFSTLKSDEGPLVPGPYGPEGQFAALWRRRRPGAADTVRRWRHLDPAAFGQQWSVPRTGRYARWIEKRFIPGYCSMKTSQERLDGLDDALLLHWPEEEGGVPRLIRYLVEEPSDLWTDDYDISDGMVSFDKFGTRPVALLERIVRTASRRGDLVLDPFCGSGTALIAAQLLRRRWAGIDISPFALCHRLPERMREYGLKTSTRGLPVTVREARALRDRDPLAFEVWAVTRIPGMEPGRHPPADDAMPGHATVAGLHETAVVAAVDSGVDRAASWKGFLRAMEGDSATAGVYITLFRSDATAKMRAAAKRMGTFRLKDLKAYQVERRRERLRRANLQRRESRSEAKRWEKYCTPFKDVDVEFPRAQIWDLETWLRHNREPGFLPSLPEIEGG